MTLPWLQRAPSQTTFYQCRRVVTANLPCGCSPTTHHGEAASQLCACSTVTYTLQCMMSVKVRQNAEAAHELLPSTTRWDCTCLIACDCGNEKRSEKAHVCLLMTGERNLLEIGAIKRVRGCTHRVTGADCRQKAWAADQSPGSGPSRLSRLHGALASCLAPL